MTTAQTLLLVGGGALAYNLFIKSIAGGNLNFYPDGVQSLDIQGISPVLKVILKIQNTSNQKLVVNSFAGNVFVDNSLIGNCENFIPVVIQRNSQTRMPINLKLSPISLINRIIDALAGGVLEVKVDVRATANVDGYVVPVDLTYNIGK